MSLEKRVEAIENVVSPAQWVTLCIEMTRDDKDWDQRCEQARLKALESGQLRPGDSIVFLAQDSNQALADARALGLPGS